MKTKERIERKAASKVPLFFFVPILIATEKKENQKKKNIKTPEPLKFYVKSNGKKEREGGGGEERHVVSPLHSFIFRQANIPWTGYIRGMIFQILK